MRRRGRSGDGVAHAYMLEPIVNAKEITAGTQAT